MTGLVAETMAKAVVSYMALAAFLCLVLSAELAFPRGRLIDRWARLRAVTFVAIYIPVGALCTALVATLRQSLGLTPILPWAVGALLGGIIADFFYYWYHRAQHSIPWLWRIHSVHHSVEELGAGTGYHHLAEAPLKALLVSVPVGLLVTIDDSFAVFFLLSIHGYYIHSTTRLNFGPIAWVMADNRVHRIHHSMEPRHFDKNFGSFTLIWDRLFGTAHFPKGDEWPDVGLAGRPEPKSVIDYFRLPRLHSTVKAHD